MFMTRKRFLEELAKVRNDTEEYIYQRQRLNEMERNIHERIDRVEQRVLKIEDKMQLNTPLTLKREGAVNNGN